MTVKLGGAAKGPKPKDGGAYIVVDGKWVAVAHDGADGVPERLSLPGKPREGGGSRGTPKTV